MNFKHNNVDINSLNKITGQGLSSSLQSYQNKPKAYINPQILNCTFLRNSKSSGNTIHINPNFKGNGLHCTSSAISCYSNTNPPQNKESQVNSIATNLCNNVSKFKKVNNVRSSTNFKWSEEKISYPTPSTSVKPVNYTYQNTAYKKVNTICRPSHRFTSKTKVINKLKTKVINNGARKSDESLRTPLINKPCKKYDFSIKRNVKSPVLRVATLVRNKYKIIKAPKNKYKIDKRKRVPEACKNKQNGVKDIRKLFPRNFYYKVRLPFNNVYMKRCYHPSLAMKNFHSWRKDKPSENITKKVNRFPNKTVVKIGGILYKSTINKLTIAPCKNKSSDQTALITPKRRVKRNSHILYVRGEKFVLDKNGKTLKRQVSKTDENKMTPKRIDIGGVTYIRKSNNILVRTNVHQARHLVNKAKNKSIATLNKLYKKSSMPCMIFHKFGKCMRHAKGLCMYKHDIKNIAICKRFLKGNCDDKKCLLSHEVIQEKMATCLHFLNGNCTRENCPYLHVKLNKNTAICEDFLHGFCNLGTNCSKRHVYVCPEFEKTGTCTQRTKCQYPHKKSEKAKTATSHRDTTEETETPQYYIKSIHSLTQKKLKKRKRALIKDEKDDEKTSNEESTISESVDCSDENKVIECVPKRVKIDDLPCFIPLKSDS